MTTPTIQLNDGNQIPAVGFGTFQIPNDGSTYQAVKAALAAGYRHVDTAVAYFNEAEVGQAVRDSGIPRNEIWVTSKLWLQDFGFEPAQRAIDVSLQKLGLDYLDLYLIHQPYGDVPGAWQAMEAAQKAGKIRSIGVSNMTPKLWQQFVPEFTTIPAVNQVEFNPYFQQTELRQLLAPHDVKLEAWAPLGQGNQSLLNEPVIQQLAVKYGKDAGQVILRYENQLGIIVFPKSVHEARIKSNLDIFDFDLTPAEMAQLAALDQGHGQHDPDAPGVADMLLRAFDVHAND
ncbi:aldo/keto reductase [Levilactobacillus brevis]|jgi:2,5-diketo-D-gluconate reductase A|uniref:Aldo/keto reductase of diketogulonate reductase family n=4 Tax=Levilactobacillus brevis TaxID=1580 RepID=Q03S14_LEVBA|nr:aldo/keto reductase [Levilactobacillus brevis]ABJ64008.1 Aldo/keto reductase of diketogulonate reductase family [Levilactobacillus brevis ATCC 367]ARQ93935.1 2,5-diketo-D-gluconic acid reductase [Levilactobacillus brevis]ARW22105.1 Glycerol 2-dehydrogenase (NADP(+)) [Levilactobacillus brevis]ARW50764.1 Glycerol 2-dehydrogenase (NADP(+)) [Levilactobacillus brevis]KLE29660.1 2,5-diketo-D-gluconic acid reductase [Levilactobacillus brevis]